MSEEFTMQMQNLRDAILGNVTIKFENGYSVDIAVGCKKSSAGQYFGKGAGRDCSPIGCDESEYIGPRCS